MSLSIECVFITRDADVIMNVQDRDLRNSKLSCIGQSEALGLC